MKLWNSGREGKERLRYENFEGWDIFVADEDDIENELWRITKIESKGAMLTRKSQQTRSAHSPVSSPSVVVS